MSRTASVCRPADRSQPPSRWRICERNGLRRITLYQLRHSCLSWLANSGEIPIAVVAAWAGHADPTVTLQNYVVPQQGDLQNAAAALTRSAERM
jgi:integrase